MPKPPAPRLSFFSYTLQGEFLEIPNDAPPETLPPDCRVWVGLLARIRQMLRASWPEGDPSQQGQRIDVLLLRNAALRQGSPFFEALLQDDAGLRRIDGEGLERGKYQPNPIITIGTENLMALFEESAGLDCGPRPEPWQQRRAANARLYRLNADPRVKFLDASIWHRYVCLDADFEANFQARLLEMAHCGQQFLYHSLASLASLEFQCRMLANAFITPLGSNGHHEAVTPFKFHSETWMAAQADNIADFLQKEGLDTLRWNTLMVDDHADEPISVVEHCPAGEAPSKRQIIAQMLQGYLAEARDTEPQTAPEADKDIIQGAMQHLRGQSCDVIFLDYLLGQSSEAWSQREYGHEFLLELATNQSAHGTARRGPLGRYWVFPISSFPFAFGDKLRQLGMEGTSDLWYISDGGDPITTPAMFRFNFLRLALLQISKCYLHPHALARLVERFAPFTDRSEWAPALDSRLQHWESMPALLSPDQRQGSEFAKTMRAFLDNEPAYKQLLTNLRAQCQRLGRDLDAVNFRDIQDQKLRLQEAYPAHEGIQLIDKQIDVFLKRIYDGQENALQCIRDAHLRTGIDLSGRQLLGLPLEIGACSKLESLNLSNNRLVFLPKELAQLGSLMRLNLTRNEFATLPDLLLDLPKLEWLDLRENPKLGDYADLYEGKARISAMLRHYFPQKTNQQAP